ncbi:MAG: glycosyltransferase family 39 protein [Planctomycetia bacterium]|nr:glycosyltransferase family 39 protein [Planctomycetia bacterium]
MRREVRDQLCVAAAAVVVFFTLLGTPYLWDEDEPKNAECAREMLEAGNWSVPQFNYALRTDKPILLYWLMLLSYKAFGVTEFAARFWSATLAVGTSLLTYHLGRLLYRAEVGLWAGLAIATCLMFGVSGRAATPDSTLIFCITLTLYLFVRFGGVGIPQSATSTTGPLARGGYSAMYAAMGFAVLAKGPVGVVLPGGILGLFLLCRAQQHALADSAAGDLKWYRRVVRQVAQTLAVRRIFAVAQSLRPLTAIAVLALVALPWYVTVGIKTDGQWLVGFLGKHNVARFTGAMEGHSGPIFYYAIAVLIGFFPWSCLLPIGIYRLIRRLQLGAPNPDRNADTFLACWAGLYIGFFSLASTKLPSYILPCYPALALLTGKLIDEYLRSPALVPRVWFRCALYTPAIIGVTLAVALPIMATYLLPGEQWLGALGISLIFGTIALVALANRAPVGSPFAYRVPTAFALMAVTFTTSLVAVAAGRISLHTTSPQIVRAAHEIAGPGAPLIGFRHYEPTLIFYARREIPSVHTSEDLHAALRRLPGACIVTRDEHLGDLSAALESVPDIPVRRPRFLRRHGEVVLVVPKTTALAAAQRDLLR